MTRRGTPLRAGLWTWLTPALLMACLSPRRCVTTPDGRMVTRRGRGDTDTGPGAVDVGTDKLDTRPTVPGAPAVPAVSVDRRSGRGRLRRGRASLRWPVRFDDRCHPLRAELQPLRGSDGRHGHLRRHLWRQPVPQGPSSVAPPALRKRCPAAATARPVATIAAASASRTPRSPPAAASARRARRRRTAWPPATARSADSPARPAITRAGPSACPTRRRVVRVVVLAVRDAHRRHRDLRRHLVRRHLSGRDETVRGRCIATAQACMGWCPPGTHNCNGLCQSNTSPNSCGTQLVHAVLDAGQRRRDLRRHPVRVQLQRRLSPVWRRLRRQLRRRQLRHHVVHRLRAAGQRERDLRRAAVRFPVRRRLPRLQRQLRGEWQRAELRYICTPCPVPANGTATCNGTSCGITCNAGFHNCGGLCVSNTSVPAAAAPASPARCRRTEPRLRRHLLRREHPQLQFDHIDDGDRRRDRNGDTQPGGHELWHRVLHLHPGPA